MCETQEQVVDPHFHFRILFSSAPPSLIVVLKPGYSSVKQL